MSSEVGENEPEFQNDDLDVVEDEELTETAVLSESEMVSTDNVGDASVEINVEELIADIEESGDEFSAHKKEVRRRLEELAEQQSLEDTYAVDFDDDD